MACNRLKRSRKYSDIFVVHHQLNSIIDYLVLLNYDGFKRG